MMLTTRKSLEACQMTVCCSLLVLCLCPFTCSLFFHYLMYPLFSVVLIIFIRTWLTCFFNVKINLHCISYLPKHKMRFFFRIHRTKNGHNLVVVHKVMHSVLVFSWKLTTVKGGSSYIWVNVVFHSS